MKHGDFQIGLEFTCGDRKFRCTDVGTRIVTAIPIENVKVQVKESSGEITSQVLTNDELKRGRWFEGPPYALEEIVFDEFDQVACEFHAIS